MTDKAAGEYRIDFIDPLFAVAVHVGLTHGVLAESWFIQWRWPVGSEWLHLFSWLLGFLTLLLSWVGYHESIKLKPIKGLWRFILDVLLVTGYAFLLIKFRNLDAVLEILIGVFILFVLWDRCKVLEYKVPYSRREWVTVGWTIAFAGLFLGRLTLGLDSIITLAVMYVFTILYRVNKEVAMWGWIRGGLARVGFGGS